jgi:hypothetical protein
MLFEMKFTVENFLLARFLLFISITRQLLLKKAARLLTFCKVKGFVVEKELCI